MKTDYGEDWQKGFWVGYSVAFLLGIIGLICVQGIESVSTELCLMILIESIGLFIFVCILFLYSFCTQVEIVRREIE